MNLPAPVFNPPTLLPLDRRDWIAGLEKGLSIIQAFEDANPRLAASVTSGFAQDVIKIASMVEQAVLDREPQLGVATRAIAIAAKN